jgi:hypothetical protein
VSALFAGIFAQFTTKFTHFAVMVAPFAMKRRHRRGVARNAHFATKRRIFGEHSGEMAEIVVQGQTSWRTGQGTPCPYIILILKILQIGVLTNGTHHRKRADTQVCPYVTYMGYDNPPSGQPHCGRCRQRPLRNNGIILLILKSCQSGFRQFSNLWLR